MSAPSVHADAPPAVVCDPEGLQYETGPQLGKGGFAICHRAQLMGHEHLGSNTVALKIVKSKMEPPKLAQKFVTELQIHSKLSHPNIVEFYRAFSFQTSTYVVLELCENGSLADAIKKRKYFTMPEIRRFMIQTCGAIKYLHQRNIVHRDLKTGNLFLDKDMNIKVGDFGLAALLVSQNDFGAIRRTTMCGTPNYLAPEVLEKTGKGHDEKVDLWAIGIMMYTLAVGRAPFHAAKREDIYRKLKAREYSWPDLAKFANEITDDLRDIVSCLLVPEDDRPTPDQIVSHAFFKLGPIPLKLDSGATSHIPKWTKSRPPSASTIRRGYTDEWFKFCQASAVGEYERGKTFGAIGSRRNKTVARDCQKEIESGKQPNIPFAEDTVYLPFPERTNWPGHIVGGLSEIPEEKESSSEGQALMETTGNDRPKGRQTQASRKTAMPPLLKENKEPMLQPEAVRRVVDKQPTRIRTVRQISNPSRITAATAAPVQLRVPRHTRAVQRTRSTKDVTREKEDPIPEAQPIRATKTASKVVGKPESIPMRKPAPINEIPPTRKSGPEIEATDPVSTLAQLRIFKENVSRALRQQESKGARTGPVPLSYVERWVDYSRKCGAGFVLSDGSFGSIMLAADNSPVTTAIVPDGQSFFEAIDRNPKLGRKILLELPWELYAACGENKSLCRVEVLDKTRLSHIQLMWKRFGMYMIRLGVSADARQAKQAPAQRHIIKFYQRLGNVIIWGFADGSFQFNFPDHSKLICSSDAGYCKFIGLSPEAVSIRDETGSVPPSYMNKREILHGSLQALLYGPADGKKGYTNVTEANRLRQKLELIEKIIGGYFRGGGVGCLADPYSYKWDGPQAEDPKADWVTVGRAGGDVCNT